MINNCDADIFNLIFSINHNIFIEENTLFTVLDSLVSAEKILLNEGYLNALFYVSICKCFKPRYLIFPIPFNETFLDNYFHKIKLLNNSLYF